MSVSTVTREGSRLVLATPFDLKDEVKKLGGRRWDKKRRRWHVPATQESALAVRSHLGDVRCDLDSLELFSRAAEADEARALRFAEELPPIPGVPPSELNPEGGGWLWQRQAYWSALPQEGYALVMGMGCLTGDSEITVNRGGNSRRRRLDEVVAKFNGGAVNSGNGFRGWDRSIPTYVRGFKADGTLGLVKLTAALDNGVKPVVKLTLKSGKGLTCTRDHEIVTPNGKVHAENLAPGDQVLTNGRYLDKDGYIRLRGTGHPREGTGGVYEHILVAEEKLGRPLNPGETVHHRNEIKHDNTPTNLDVKTSHSEHMQEHVDVLRLDEGQGLFIPLLDEVVSVDPAGEAYVYDLSVDDDAHAYIANGIVVGNTGKSLVSVKLYEAWNVELVIELCPSKVRKVWPREFAKWGERDWIVDNGRFRKKRGDGWRKGVSLAERVERMKENLKLGYEEDRPVALVVNYEAFWQGAMREFLMSLEPDVLGLDEMHKIKKAGGKWSKSASELRKRVRPAGKVLGKTGTVMPHSEPDVYGQFRTIDPGIFGTNFSHFQRRFFEMGGFEGKEVEGFLSKAAEDEFNAAWQRLAYICDEDVLDLPGAIDMPAVTCELDAEAAKAYQNLADDFITWVGGGEEDGEPVTAANTLARLLRLQQVTSGHLFVGEDEEREVVSVGEEKKKLLRDELEDLPPGEPAVVYARFTEDLRRIEEVAAETGRRYAEISGHREDGLVEDPDDPSSDGTMNPDCDLLGVQIQAGAEGIDLTRSCYGFFYSLILDLGLYAQVRKRQDRPGQTKLVRFGFLVAEGTVDEIIIRALRERKDIVEACIAAAKEHGRLEVTPAEEGEEIAA